MKYVNKFSKSKDEPSVEDELFVEEGTFEVVNNDRPDDDQSLPTEVKPVEFTKDDVYLHINGEFHSLTKKGAECSECSIHPYRLDFDKCSATFACLMRDRGKNLVFEKFEPNVIDRDAGRISLPRDGDVTKFKGKYNIWKRSDNCTACPHGDHRCDTNNPCGLNVDKTRIIDMSHVIPINIYEDFDPESRYIHLGNKVYKSITGKNLTCHTCAFGDIWPDCDYLNCNSSRNFKEVTPVDIKTAEVGDIVLKGNRYYECVEYDGCDECDDKVGKCDCPTGAMFKGVKRMSDFIALNETFRYESNSYKRSLFKESTCSFVCKDNCHKCNGPFVRVASMPNDRELRIMNRNTSFFKLK